MANQPTQRDTLQIVREEDFMGNQLSADEREQIKAAHRQAKSNIMKREQEEISRIAEHFENRVLSLGGDCWDYYIDVIRYLQDEEAENLYWQGYKKYALNSPTFWRWLEKVNEVFEGIVNY